MFYSSACAQITLPVCILLSSVVYCRGLPFGIRVSHSRWVVRDDRCGMCCCVVLDMKLFV